MPKVSEAHRQERREQILDAALACFVERGFQGTSMNDVLQAAGLSAGAVYSYFASKQELAVAVGRRALTAQLTSGPFDPASEGIAPPTELVRALVGRVSGARVPPSILVQLWGEAATDSEFRDLVAQSLAGQRALITAALERWFARPGSDVAAADTAARAAETLPILIALVQGWLLQSVIDPGFDAERYVAGAARLFGE